MLNPNRTKETNKNLTENVKSTEDESCLTIDDLLKYEYEYENDKSIEDESCITMDDLLKSEDDPEFESFKIMARIDAQYEIIHRLCDEIAEDEKYLVELEELIDSKSTDESESESESESV